jgi:MinD superfamily P-loop ATPase
VIIAIASGKGGTGKTSVAVNLALSLTGAVRLLDCDADEPNVHTLLRIRGKRTRPVFVVTPRIDDQLCTRCKRCADFCATHALFIGDAGPVLFPNLCTGCGGCSLVCPTEAIAETRRQIGVVTEGQVRSNLRVAFGTLDVAEPFVVPVIKAVKQNMRSWRGTDVIIDSPPGVSCPMVESVHGADFCLLVTEPTPFGLHDLRLAVTTVRELGMSLGVVVNKKGIGDTQVYDYCRAEHIPILLEIPHSRKIAALFAEGIPFVHRMPTWKRKFQALFREVERRASA